MVNPYSAPTAQLHTEQDLVLKSNTGWKIFFWLMLLLNIGTVIAGLFESTIIELWNIGWAVIYCLVMLALFGFAFNKAFIRQFFWKVFVFVALIFDISSVVTELPLEVTEYSNNLSTLGIVVLTGLLGLTAVLLMLQYWALFHYAYRRDYLWRNKA